MADCLLNTFNVSFTPSSLSRVRANSVMRKIDSSAALERFNVYGAVRTVRMAVVLMLHCLRRVLNGCVSAIVNVLCCTDNNSIQYAVQLILYCTVLCILWYSCC